MQLRPKKKILQYIYIYIEREREKERERETGLDIDLDITAITEALQRPWRRIKATDCWAPMKIWWVEYALCILTVNTTLQNRQPCLLAGRIVPFLITNIVDSALQQQGSVIKSVISPRLCWCGATLGLLKRDESFMR